VDAQGNFVFVNPQPGQLGNYGLTTIIGPGRWSLDMNLIKRITITEAREFEFRLTAENVLNHSNWSNPDMSINSLYRLTGECTREAFASACPAAVGIGRQRKYSSCGRRGIFRKLVVDPRSAAGAR
jgi:hypothetical protein